MEWPLVYVSFVSRAPTSDRIVSRYAFLSAEIPMVELPADFEWEHEQRKNNGCDSQNLSHEEADERKRKLCRNQSDA